jgi:hypothetical protein
LAPSIWERKVTAFSLHGAAPAGEFLQAAEGGNAFGARPQHQMVGIAKHDIGAGLAHLAPMHPLHRARGADRHEGRRPHHAMRRGQPAGTGRAVGGEQFEMIGKAHGWLMARQAGLVQPR